MAERIIDLNRCLFQYTNVMCNRCEEICPRKAIHNREVDESLCDDCGLCTAVCPTGAIQSAVDYDGCLQKTTTLEPQVLMCQKVDKKSMTCLGGLNRRLLWSLAEKRDLAIDTSRCEVCNPTVSAWLDGEIEACNEALLRQGRKKIALVHVREEVQKAPQVARRGFFRSLFRSTAQGVKDFTEEQIHRQYTFDPVLWLEKQQTTANELFPGLSLGERCNGCGLCVALCPERALTIQEESEGHKLTFDPSKCSACELCVGNCPRGTLKLLPSFAGKYQL